MSLVAFSTLFSLSASLLGVEGYLIPLLGEKLSCALIHPLVDSLSFSFYLLVARLSGMYLISIDDILTPSYLTISTKYINSRMDRWYHMSSTYLTTSQPLSYTGNWHNHLPLSTPTRNSCFASRDSHFLSARNPTLSRCCCVTVLVPLVWNRACNFRRDYRNRGDWYS
jgi:hypothetical protein